MKVSSAVFENPKSMARVEELFGAVNATGCEKFLGADDAQFVALLAADQILTTFARRVSDK